MHGINRFAQAGKSWLRRLVYGRALHRAIMYERACEEADERHPGLYELEFAQARREVKRLSGLNGEASMTDLEVEETLQQLWNCREHAKTYESLADRLENKLHGAGITFRMYEVGTSWKRVTDLN